MVDRFKRLFWISRPRFWFYLAGPFLVGAVYGVNSLADLLSPALIVGFGYWLVLGNLFLYGVNDLADGDTDQFNLKKGSKEVRLGKGLEETDLKIGIFLSWLLGIGWVFWFGFNWWLFMAWLVLSWGYSQPPVRFKARPILDALSNILYIIPGLLSYVWLTGDLPSWPIILAGLAWTAAMQLFSAIPDIEADQQANLKTSAILLGKEASLICCGILWMLAVCLIVPYFSFWWIGLIYPLVIGGLLINKSWSADRAYWYFPWINVIVGFVLVFSRLLTV